MSILLFAFGAGLGPRNLLPATEPTNPLSATSDVIAAGKVVYERSCAACHGTAGRGDGPAAQSLAGLPADFTSAHFATHRDSELFGWIKGGKPGTAMPAFGDTLSEEQIWQVLTYIRQFAPTAQQP